MKHFEFSYKNPSGIEIYGQGWEPDKNKPRAAVLLVHGLGEHSGRYLHVAKVFCEKGFTVFASDRAGHGKSKGKRGHIKKYEHYFDEVHKLHAEAVRKYADIACFAYGHSWVNQTPPSQHREITNQPCTHTYTYRQLLQGVTMPRSAPNVTT